MLKTDFQKDLQIQQSNFQMKIFFLLLFSLTCLPIFIQAFELETRIPESAFEAEINFISVPAHDQAYNGYGKEAPLQQIFFWDQTWRESVSGKIEREEQRLEFKLAYGLSDEVLMQVEIPFVSKKQTSSLSYAAGTDAQKLMISNLNATSKSISGLGDMELGITKVMSSGSTWYNSGGITLRLPTGDSANAQGVFAHTIGEGHPAIGAYFHLTWYPLTHGLRNGFRAEATNEWNGKRKTLSGEEVYYSAGNTLNGFYNLSLERNNLFLGTELHYKQQSASNLPGERSNFSYLKEISFEFGYGNLSDLEMQPQGLPWQFRLGYSLPLEGMNIAIVPQINLSIKLYF